MKNPVLTISALLFIFLLFLFPASGNAESTLDIHDFTNFPAVRNVKISPDGLNLSIVFKKQGRDFLGILDRRTLKVLKTFGVKGARKSVGKVYWVNNKRIVYSVTQSYAWDKEIFDNGELVGVNIDGTQHKLIFGYGAGESQIATRRRAKKAEYGNQEIIDLLKKDDKNILIAFFPWRVKGHTWVNNENAKTIIYRLNVYTGEKQSIDYLPLPNASAITDTKGRVRFAVGEDDNNYYKIFFKPLHSNSWQPFDIKDFEGRKPRPLSFTEDNNKVYISANVDSGTRALYLFNLKTGSIKKIFHDSNVDISDYIRDFSGRKVVAVATDLGKPEYHFLDQKSLKVKYQKMFLKSFRGNDVVITSATRLVDFLIVFVYSDTNPGDFYLFDTKKRQAHYIVSRRKQIDPKYMATSKSLVFKARDGQILHGYITLPFHQHKNLPMVVLPHGGPHGIRDRWGFDWETQLLANRGYAVLQVNFRGSGGFGIKFLEDGYGKWGTLMQDDITDATKEMITKGIADPNRICIYGASYGAYAALMGVVREPNLYQCAIGSAGVYNLPMMFQSGDIATRKNGIAYLKDALGEDIQDQKNRSPVYNVNKIKAPVLLIHGTKDRRAPIEQARSLMKALKQHHKKFEWLKVSSEGHGYYDGKNRVKVYSRILKFLDKYIGANAVHLSRTKHSATP